MVVLYDAKCIKCSAYNNDFALRLARRLGGARIMTTMIPQCYFCKLHEKGIKCAKYDQIAPEILVNLMKRTFKEDTDAEG